MSHFTVAVFTRTDDHEELEALLDPFNECTEEKEYLEFQPCPKTKEEVEAKYEVEKENYEDFEDFLLHYYGYRVNEATGEYGYTCNPNAKWDWWQIGGRWGGLLKIKKDGACDNSAKVADVDFTPDQNAYNKAIRFWEVVVEGKERLPHENKEDFFHFYKPEYYIQYYGTKEAYAESCSCFSTYAFLTADGEWVGKGDMGWFGMGTDTGESAREYQKKLDKYIADHPELYITIIDCHI